MPPRVLIKNPDGSFEHFSETPPPAAAPGEITWQIPGHLGEGCFRNLSFGSGLSVTTSDCLLNETYHARIEHGKPLVTFAFSVSGRAVSENGGLARPVGIKGGESFTHYLPDPVLARSISPREHQRAVAIKIAPERLNSLVAEDLKRVPPGFGRILQGDLRAPFFCLRQTTPAMKAALHQMIHCPYTGAVRKLLIESKAMELIAYKLEQLSEVPGSPCAEPLAGADADRIRRARDLLVRDLQAPPSLMALARASGMPHTKLNRGFRALFGCTVFEYLRRQRLEYARSLLGENRMNVTEAAFTAGFCSSSHFTQAFSKHFGVRPGVYRKSVSSRIGNDH